MWLMLAATASLSLTQVVLIGGVVTSLLGLVVTIFKVKPESNIQTANAISQFNAQLLQDRDSWQKRALDAEQRSETYRDELDSVRDELEKCREELERCRDRHRKQAR